MLKGKIKKNTLKKDKKGPKLTRLTSQTYKLGYKTNITYKKTF